MQVMLNTTTEPIGSSRWFEGCVAAVEMCEVVAGGAEAFQRRPFATCYIDVTSGLPITPSRRKRCRKVRVLAEGLPRSNPADAGGVNSPVTRPPGCMASMDAGVMLGIVLSQ